MATEADRPIISGSEPQLFVSDLAAALDFYVETLGFRQAFVHGDPPFYAQVIRDGGKLNLRAVHGPVFDAGFRDRALDALSATLTLNDAESLYREFEARGATFHQTLRTEPWGARTFIVRDPDNNLIAFVAA